MHCEVMQDFLNDFWGQEFLLDRIECDLNEVCMTLNPRYSYSYPYSYRKAPTLRESVLPHLPKGTGSGGRPGFGPPQPPRGR